MEELMKKLCDYIEKAGSMNLDATDQAELSNVIDMYKDLKEVENMNNGYGRYDSYGNEYGRDYNNYSRRGVDEKYRATKYMDGLRGSYEAYEDARNEYNNGNYGAKEEGLKELDYALHSVMNIVKMIKQYATSPEEQEIIRKHLSKLSEM